MKNFYVLKTTPCRRNHFPLYLPFSSLQSNFHVPPSCRESSFRNFFLRQPLSSFRTLYLQVMKPLCLINVFNKLNCLHSISFGSFISSLFNLNTSRFVLLSVQVVLAVFRLRLSPLCPRSKFHWHTEYSKRMILQIVSLYWCVCLPCMPWMLILLELSSLFPLDIYCLRRSHFRDKR